MQYVKHYFPNYKVPGKIITYIGPADGDGDGISDRCYHSWFALSSWVKIIPFTKQTLYRLLS